MSEGGSAIRGPWSEEAKHEEALGRVEEAFELGPVDKEFQRALDSRVVLPDEKVGFVYFLQVGDDSPIKVGWTADVAARLGTLQTGHWEEVSVVGRIAGPMSLEGDAHYELTPHRIRGEWFEREPALALLAAWQKDRRRAHLKRVA